MIISFFKSAGTFCENITEDFSEGVSPEVSLTISSNPIFNNSFFRLFPIASDPEFCTIFIFTLLRSTGVVVIVICDA